jgi:intracellular multiplication protein IcmM
MVLNLSLGFGVHFAYFNRPERDYYSTNGITAPEKLTPMSSRNTTSVALLASDPIVQIEEKRIPE